MSLSPEGAVPVISTSATGFDFLAPPQNPDEMGRLGPYRVLGLLGAGGMGAVFRAEDAQLQRQVALKVMLPKYAADSVAKQRFLREARLAAAVEHDHVVPIFQVGEDHGVPFLAMPLLRGESLADRLKRERRVPAAEAVRLARQMCEGLAAAHAQHLIHRDVKPANIWLETPPQTARQSSRQRVRLLDFGLARNDDDRPGEHLTSEGAILGTPAYMAPEQAKGEALDGRSDLFSVGTVLYQMVTGEQPFQRKSLPASLLAVTSHEPRPPIELEPSLPVELDTLIRRLMAKDASARPGSAAEAADELERIEGTLSAVSSSNVSPSTASSVQSSTQVAPGQATVTFAGAETKTRSRKTRRPVAILGIALCGMVAAVVVWQIAGTPQEPEDKQQQPVASGGKAEDKTQVKPPANPEPEEDDDRPFTQEPSGPDPMRPLPPWDLPADAPKPAVFPFDAAQARAYQEAWAKYLGKPLTVENKLGMKFMLIPPGEFDMTFYPGWEPSPNTAKRRTRLTDAFYFSTTHVTVEQFERFVTATGYKTEAESSGEGGGVPPDWNKRHPQYTWRKPWDFPVNPKQPVTQVTRNDALAYCAWLSKQDNETYRLPTEAERYYACRAGNTTKYGVTDDATSLDEYQWLRPSEMAGESPVRPVGLKKANSFGLFDINGNASDWCLDALGVEQVRSSSRINPVALNLSSACQRGSQGFKNTVTPEGRAFQPLSSRYCVVGFHVVREPTPRPFEYIFTPPPSQPGERLSPRALVSRPGKITGLRSWSVELAAASPASYVACQPGGELVATAGFGGPTVRIWDKAGQLNSVFVGHEFWVGSLSWSPDGRHLASGSFESSLRVWDVETGRCVAKYDGNGPNPKIEFSPQGRLLAIGALHYPIRVLDPVTGIVRTAKESLKLRQICWAPDGSQLATADDDGKVRIWDVASLQAVAELPFPDRQDKDEKLLLAVAWSPDGKRIAASGADHRIRIWDAMSHAHAGTMVAGYIQSLAWHKDGRHLASCGDPELTLWDVLESKAQMRFGGSPGGRAVAWTSDYRELVVLPIGASQPVFFDAATGKARQLAQRPARIDDSSWAVCPDGRQVSAVRDRNIRLFDADTGQLKDELPLPSLFTHQAWSPHGDRIAMTNRAAAHVPVTVLDLKTKKIRSATNPPTASFNPTWSPDGRRIAVISSTEPVVRIYDDRGNPVCELVGHEKPVVDVLWTSDSARLVTCGPDNTVRVWDTSSGFQVGIFRDPSHPLTHNRVTHNRGIDGRQLVWRQQDRTLLVLSNQAAILRLNLITGAWDVWDAWGTHSRYWPYSMMPSKDGRTISVMTDPWYQHLLSPKERRFRYIEPTGLTAWFSDDQRMLIENGSDAQGYDTATDRRLGTLIPNIEGDQWLMVGPDGHYRGSKGIEKQIVYVALHEDGSQKIYTPAEFATTFGWKNDPDKATFLKTVR